MEVSRSWFVLVNKVMCFFLGGGSCLTKIFKVHGGGGCFSFGGTVQYIEESNIYLCFVVYRLKRGLVTWPNLRVIKRRISYPFSSRTLVPLFSGSGAVKIMDLYEDEPNDDYESYAMRQRMQPHGGQLMMTTQVTTKVPPGFDGKTSWFAFEDAIDDWCDITELEAEKWGPALRNRLEGEASVYKRLLDREQLREPNGRGIEYFKRTLRPHFVKGAQTVFLYRFMRFMKNNRGNGDLMKWMTRFQIDGRRLEESWMDLCPELDLTSPAIVAEVTARRNAHNNAQAALFAADNNHVVIPWTDEMIQVVHNEAIGLHRQQHRDLFPLSPNLIALIFISTADLSQDQRQSLTSIMTHRNRTMDQYRVGELRETFIEMFCTVKTAVDNPMMNPSGSGGRRAFLVLEEGDLDGSFGYWGEDEEDGAEGFLDALEDVFWIWDDNDYSWFQRRFQGRRTRKGKGKGKGRKGKGKGKGGRRFFRPRNKGKEKEREKEKVILLKMIATMPMKNGKDTKMKIGMKAIGPMKMKQHGNPKAGMNGKSMMNTDISKEKERKERKEKEKERKVMDLQNKEKDKVMGKEKQTMWTHHILLNRQCSKQLYLRQRVPLVSLWHIQM